MSQDFDPVVADWIQRCRGAGRYPGHQGRYEQTRRDSRRHPTVVPVRGRQSGHWAQG